MLPQVADARAGEEATAVAGAQDDLQGAAPLELRHRILPAGEAIVDIGGELDIATAEPAVRYVRQVIDRHRRPVIVDLTALRFCDAKGLNGLPFASLHVDAYALVRRPLRKYPPICAVGKSVAASP